MKTVQVNRFSITAATLSVFFGIALPGECLAQSSLSAEELLRRGTAAWGINCVTSSMNYFALLQKFPERLDQEMSQSIKSYISECERWPFAVGGAGFDAKYDAELPIDECIGYAEIAVAEQRAQQAGGCGFEGGRWSTNMQSHFDWCMNEDVPRSKVRKERDERRKALDKCLFR